MENDRHAAFISRDEDGSEWRVAPYVVLRVAGLPTSYAAALAGRRATEASDALHRCAKRLEKAGEALAFHVYALVPGAASDQQRRRLLRCKRDAHNRRPLKEADRAVLMACPAFDAALVEAYAQALCGMREGEDRFAAALEADRADTRAVLDRARREESFRQGLALASPSLFAQLGKSGRKPKHQKQTEETLFAYMLRASAKISPFSTFASFTLVPIRRSDGETPDGALSLRASGETILNRSYAVALRQALGSPAQGAPEEACLEVNATLRFDERNQAYGTLRMYKERRGGLWSEEQDTVLALSPELIRALRRLPPRFSWAALIDGLTLEAGGAPDVGRVARMLLRKDILRPVPQWGAHQSRPMTELADRLSRQDRPGPQACLTLRRLDEQAQSVAALPAEARVRAVSDIRAGFDAVYENAVRRPPPFIRTPVLEDVWGEGLELGWGPTFLTNAVQRAGLAVARRASLSLEYLWFRRYFLQQFGAGGTCTDLYRLLKQTWRPFVAFSQGLAKGSMADLPADSAAGIVADELRLPISLYMQSCAEDGADLALGRSRLVLNGVYHRIGWQLARMTSSGTPGAAARARSLRRWLETAGEKRLVTFSVSGESSNLQMHRRLFPAHLCLDQQVRMPGDLTLHQLGLRHDERSGLLEIVDENGAPVRLHYLGSASNMLSWGLVYLLFVLSEPVQIGRPSFGQLGAATEEGRDILHQKRLEEENCLLMRETWWLRCRFLLDRWKGLDLIGMHRQFLALMEEHGLPGDGFAQAQFTDYFSWRSVIGEKLRKPIFCRFANPLCMQAIVRLVSGADWLVITEAVPHPAKSWLSVNGRAHVAELQAEMVVTGGKLAQGWITNWRPNA